jgi:hypothetical protein
MELEGGHDHLVSARVEQGRWSRPPCERANGAGEVVTTTSEALRVGCQGGRDHPVSPRAESEGGHDHPVSAQMELEGGRDHLVSACVEQGRWSRPPSSSIKGPVWHIGVGNGGFCGVVGVGTDASWGRRRVGIGASRGRAQCGVSGRWWAGRPASPPTVERTRWYRRRFWTAPTPSRAVKGMRGATKDRIGVGAAQNLPSITSVGVHDES